MSLIRTILVYQLRDLVRGRWMLVYGLFFLVAAELLLRYGGGDAKALLSLGSVVLFVVPLVTSVYATVYLYHSREFIELLLAQPVRRDVLYVGLYLGITLALAAGAVTGLVVPFAVHRVLLDTALRRGVITLLFATVSLTCAFTGVAFLIATWCEDRMRGLGAAVAAWLSLSLVYDALVLVAVATAGNIPLERAVLGAMFFNPIDLARVLLLMQFDAAALMGYTGAVFQRFFGGFGMLAAVLAMGTWIALPAIAGARAFRRKDF